MKHEQLFSQKFQVMHPRGNSEKKNFDGSRDDYGTNTCRSVDPIITLNVPEMGRSSLSSLSFPTCRGKGSSVSSICFLTPTSITGGSPFNHNNSRKKYKNMGSGIEDDFVCNSSDSDDEGGGEEDSEDDNELNLKLRCHAMIKDERRHDNDPSSKAREAAAALSLSSTLIASCDTNGNAVIWDLGQRKIVHELSTRNGIDDKTTQTNYNRRGPGLVLRRLGTTANNSRRPQQYPKQMLMLYQTRDPKGTVTIHDLEGYSGGDSAFHKTSNNGNNNSIVVQYETYSQTFCASAPCAGNPNLLALPSERDDYVTVRDIRCDPHSSHPVAKFHGASAVDVNDESQRKHGMLTSIAMAESTNQAGGRPILACGLESGTLFFHDLGMLNNRIGSICPMKSVINMGSDAGSDTDTKSATGNVCCIKLSEDPVLALDMSSSSLPATSSAEGSVLAVAGLAGDSIRLNSLPEADRGTIAVVKATLQQSSNESSSKLRARIRARLGTCSVTGANGSNGKPGVSICRFSPDGRVFAVGGWDKRLRIFDRTRVSTNPLAILRGHTASVNAVDWAPDADVSGVFATGSCDGRIFVWRCFA